MRCSPCHPRAIGEQLRYRYRLVKRPQHVVESNPAICSVALVFRGTRIPVSVVVEQLCAGTPRQELEGDFPQLSQQHFRELQRQAARAPEPEHTALQWLLIQPSADQPRSKAAIDAQLAAERDW